MRSSKYINTVLTFTLVFNSSIRFFSVPNALFYVPQGLCSTLTQWGIAVDKVHELMWGDERTLPGHNVTVVCLPAQHWSMRSGFDRCKVRLHFTDLIYEMLADALVGLGDHGRAAQILLCW